VSERELQLLTNALSGFDEDAFQQKRR